MPVENLLTPDYLRRVLWKPPVDDGRHRRPRWPRSCAASVPAGGRSRSWRRCSTQAIVRRGRSHSATADAT